MFVVGPAAGLPEGGLAAAECRVEGVVEMLLDATHGYAHPLTEERLWGWQEALFTTITNTRPVEASCDSSPHSGKRPAVCPGSLAAVPSLQRFVGLGSMCAPL